MPRYVSPESKAACTVTFRLTYGDRRLLEHLAQSLGTTQTDLFRALLLAKANDLGLSAPPPKERPRRGRPKQEAPSAPAPQAPQAFLTQDIPINVVEQRAQPLPEEPRSTTLRELVREFREHFSGRAEGTRRELEDALRVFTVEAFGDGPLLPLALPLAELTLERLAHLRESIRAMDERVARKNLQLTYLRMMLQFGARHPLLTLPPGLAEAIPPFTALEVATGMFKGRPPGE